VIYVLRDESPHVFGWWCISDDRCIDIPHPRKSLWNNFFFALTMLVEEPQMQWNSVKKEMMPWIDLNRVKAMHDVGKYDCTAQFVRSHGGRNGHHHHHHHHTRYSTQNDHLKSPPSDCQKNGSSSKWLPKQKRPEQESPTSDNQKKEVSSKDQLPYFKDMPTGRKLLQLCPIPPVAHSPVCSTLSSQFP